jgi:hypothetical protein
MYLIEVQIHDRTHPTFHNKDALLKKIDELPSFGLEFQCTRISVNGNLQDPNGNNLTEDLELWHRDPVKCVEELISNPAFQNVMHYAPERIYEDETCAE